MAKVIVNLALDWVNREAELILDQYDHHPYQQAFSIPDIRHKLICYVLSRTPGVYKVVDEQEMTPERRQSRYLDLAQRMQIQELLHQGIRQILSEDGDWIDRHIPEEAGAGCLPSIWFG